MEYLKEMDVVLQLKESLNCEIDELESVVNILNMTEYWVENEMLNLCEDNVVMRKALWNSYKEFIRKYKGQNLSLNELYDGRNK